MAKRIERTKRQRQASHTVEANQPSVVPFSLPPAREPIKAQTPKQERYMRAIQSNDLVFGLGPAGTGKTYIAAGLAAEAFAAKRTRKIIVTRPAVEAGESLGFLPGELEEKYEPYLRPVREVFIERLGGSQFDYAIKAKQIEPIPLAYMRGMTFRDCFVILDEAQNVSPKQMLMFLTRIGQNCTVIVNGDVRQKDTGDAKSGLEDAIQRCRGLPGVSVVEFKTEDIVRSGLVKAILERYDQ